MSSRRRKAAGLVAPEPVFNISQIADPFMLHIYAALAEKERRLISARTTAALQAAKAKGVRLGRYGAEQLAPAYRAEAVERATALAPVVADIRSAGGSSLRQIAVALNARGLTTAKGGVWSAMQVRRVLDRAAS